MELVTTRNQLMLLAHQFVVSPMGKLALFGAVTNFATSSAVLKLRVGVLRRFQFLTIQTHSLTKQTLVFGPL